MINLLPPSLKDEYNYGRRNLTLRRYAITLAFGLLGVALLTGAGLFLMQQSINSNNKQLASTQKQLDDGKLDQTRKQAEDITGSLKLAVNVLSQEILFSKLLTQIGQVTPSNTILTDLSITQIGGGIDIKAKATDITSATQLQVNLSDPKNQIFSKADIQSISCTASSSDPKYPCTVTLRALFNTNNPFLFINKGTSK